MVKAGLKVGDTFEDGGRTYTVTKVLPDGRYVSTADIKVKKAEEDESDVEADVEEEDKHTKRTVKRKQNVVGE